MIVLIPSYEPDERLLKLIHQLNALGEVAILVVDDGSGEAYSDIFRSVRESGCTVLTHRTNQGKGRALKTGFDYIRKTGETDGVVCADSDGQHLPEDIIRIARTIKAHPHHIILGYRRFTGTVPLRSRFGNSTTRMVYSLTTGSSIQDTQTGLRGYSVDMLDWLCQIPGERFEYEMNLLLAALAEGYSFYEVEIDTVYLNDNKSSHFRPLIDSARIYFPLVKFSGSSILSAILDIGLLLLIQLMTSNLLFAVVGARMCSSIFNYTMNRKFVFSTGKGSAIKKSLPRY
ncbi:MAG: glycosyltransferase family 2 protein, partial [Gorillibacterium sp.]|nr:glycosyltransferase family 2 protein [Gorillibacterium sp.]